MSPPKPQEAWDQVPIALQYLDTGVAIFDQDLCLAIWNQQFVEILNFPEAMMKRGLRLEDFFRCNAERGEYGAGDIDELIDARMALIQQRISHKEERDRADGRVIEVKDAPLPDGGVVFMYEDISDHVNAHKEIEAKLEASHKRLSDIAESASDWFWEMGPDFRFIYLSSRFFKIFDLERDAIIGKTREEFANQSEVLGDPEKWQRHRQDLENHLPVENFIYSAIVRGGTIGHIRISGIPIFDEKGNFEGYRGAGTNVTKEVEAERALIHAKEQAEEANRAKSEFLSRMSHELRTPLNGILGFTQLLQYNPKEKLSPLQTKYTDDILQAGNHLLALINEVLDLAKIESGNVTLKFEPVDVAVLVRECMLIVAPISEVRDIKLVDETAHLADPIHILADFVRIKEIMINLLSNAIKYNREHGTVFVRCQDQLNGKVRVFVRDTGKGISQAKQMELFQPFNRLGEEYGTVEGTGIGLTITRRLVELMGGEIGVVSKSGEGSTFWFDIPSADAAQKVEESEQKVVSDAFVMDISKTGDHDILYVEDNAANIRLMEGLFKDIPNLTLHIARNGLEGLKRVERIKPSLMLLDMELPVLNGMETLEELRKKDAVKDTPVIALSASAMPKDIEQALDAGCIDYQTKPINLGRFLMCICDALVKYGVKSQK
ncbi:PAS-domain containing protein [Terasakiella sp. A23]|uniref:hybrid sensor histidine kinase/response regulator n=1 Tax=Terasakiella sp. FCG-A23 TaxID=3080561 RepID=UPI00295311F1|nr:PAS-domain containing protein [Terasakiella sp. A23]MDV7339741.1 PAS-domain containing protein [Terasakiella sp. A23]